MLFTSLVQANLNTREIGRTMDCFTKTESTNDDAWDMFKEDGPSGYVVGAEIQSKGRGRRGNTWHTSPDKGLAFSILLRPMTPVSQSGLFSIATAVAIHKALNEYKIDTQVKWPNDILINGKKVAGILCESRISGNKISGLVIGIGLNVNNRSEDFSSELLQTSSSLFISNGQTFQRERILASILNTLERIFDELINIGPGNIISYWESACSHLNKNITIKHESKEIVGQFLSIDESGSAILDINGQKKEFNGGVILKTDEEPMI